MAHGTALPTGRCRRPLSPGPWTRQHFHGLQRNLNSPAQCSTARLCPPISAKHMIWPIRKGKGGLPGHPDDCSFCPHHRVWGSYPKLLDNSVPMGRRTHSARVVFLRAVTFNCRDPRRQPAEQLARNAQRASYSNSPYRRMMERLFVQ